MTTPHVTLNELAGELGLHKTSLSKAVRKLGIATLRVRSLKARGQASSAVTAADAEIIRKHYAWRMDDGDVLTD